MSNHKRSTDHQKPPKTSRSLGKRIFLIGLAMIAGLYGTILAMHAAYPRRQAALPTSLLEQCRELCLNYGLIPTGHLANDANDYLAVAKPQELSSPLAEILADKEFIPIETQPHPLLGQPAPDFLLQNDRKEDVSLREILERGPVIVVFYYGYTCSHCVAQLFALQKDLSYFRELDAQVIAISADAPEHTAEQFAEYGRFEFPTLSDLDNTVAKQYGVFAPATATTAEDRKHGTFVIDRTGRIVFADYGYKPFLDNKTLLFRLADRHTQDN